MATANFTSNSPVIYATDILDGADVDEVDEIIKALQDCIVHGLKERRLTYESHLNGGDHSFIRIFYREYIFHLILRDGYYWGCNIDIEVTYEDPESGEEEDVPPEEWPKEVMDKLEEVLSKHTTPLRRMATFSNGETMYKEIQPEIKTEWVTSDDPNQDLGH